MRFLKYFIPVLMISGSILAQDSPGGQGVELPQFVITGQEVITFPPLNKINPDHVSSLSKEFISPLFSPEELVIKEIPSPLKSGHVIFDSVRFFNTGLDAAFGNNALPRINGYISIPSGNTLFRAGVNLLNVREYLPKSNFSKYGGDISFSHLLDEEGGFLPDHTFFADAGFNYSAFGFYGSPLLTAQRRKVSDGLFRLGIREITDRNINYEISFTDNYLSVPEEDSLSSPGVTENYLGVSGKGKWILPALEIGSEITYFTQDYKAGDASLKTNYFKVKGTGFLKPFEEMKAGGGLEFSKFGDISHLHPYAYFSMQINRNFSLFGEFNPSTEFITAKGIVGLNRYANMLKIRSLDGGGRTGYFINKHISFNAAAKYEFRRYFEINAGAGFFKADNYYYFEDVNKAGLFEPKGSNVNSYNGFANFNFFPSPYGSLFGEFRYNRITDTDGNLIPYNPEWKFKLDYGYDFTRDWSGGVKITYFPGAFSDMENKNKLNSVFNLGLSTTYKLGDNADIYLEGNNLLGQEIYYLRDYREELFDILGGINIRF